MSTPLTPEQRQTLEAAYVHAAAGGDLLDNVLRGWNQPSPEMLATIADALREAARLIDQARGGHDGN